MGPLTALRFVRYNSGHLPFLCEGDSMMIFRCRSSRSIAGVVMLLPLMFVASSAVVRAANEQTIVPPALADLRGFRGRIEYDARPDSASNGQVIHGTLVVGGSGWSLDEITRGLELQTDAQGASIKSNSQIIVLADVLNSDALS